MVITPSETVRKQAMERFRLRPERVTAVPEAAAGWLRPVEGRSDTPYFLYVGPLEPRKNLPALVEAWREVRRRHPIDLLLVGKRRADCPPLAEEPGLRLLGEVPDEQLSELYSGALAFVYPSHYEGFGLPALEAMQCGACVIASSALRETGGDAAVYADGAAEMVRAMLRAAEDAGWLAECRARSLARAREFSWDRTARLTREVYREACKRFEA
jgi:glycosyltransferase involved in cell wall biosynthesis